MKDFERMIIEEHDLFNKISKAKIPIPYFQVDRYEENYPECLCAKRLNMRMMIYFIYRQHPNKFDNRSYFKELDYFLSHTIEEIREFQDSIETNVCEEKQIDELIDILNYLSTIIIMNYYYLYKNETITESKETLRKNFISRCHYFSSNFSRDNFLTNYKRYTDNIINQLLDIRVEFKERKTHRSKNKGFFKSFFNKEKFNVEQVENVSERIYLIIRQLEDLMMVIFQFNNTSKISEYIIKKNLIILNRIITEYI